MSKSHKNKEFTTEHCEKISKSLTGKKKTKNHIDKIRESNITTWQNKNITSVTSLLF